MFPKLLNFVKRQRQFFIVVVAFMVVPVAACDDFARGGCQAEKHGPAGQAIFNLYEKYSWKSEKSIQNQSAEELSKYFDGALVRLFERDMNCRIEEEGVCNVDFSVLYFAQDFDISDFRVCAVEKDGRAVDVSFNNMGDPQTIRFLMLQTTDGWRISDVIYNDEASLVDMLKN